MGKRKSADKDEDIRRKIRRLQGKLRKKKFVIESSDTDGTDSADTDEYEPRGQSPCLQTPPRPPYSPLTGASMSSPEVEPRGSRPSQAAGFDAAQEPVPSTSNQESTANPEIPLQNDVLLLLGDAPKADVTFGKPIHTDIASRWQEILAKGLPTEVKSKLVEEYPIPSNCDLLVAPLLNPEAKAAMTGAIAKRDYAMMEKQKQLGFAISALGQAVDSIVSNETSAQKILKPISDACRLLCDIHFVETKTRRNLITYCTNTKLKETVLETTRDKFLFGENLAEKLKSAKSIQQSGESLRIKKQQGYFNKNTASKTNNNNLNSQGYYRNTRFKNTQKQAPPEKTTGPRRTRDHRSPRREIEKQKRSSYRR